jgi:hypothetical protein
MLIPFNNMAANMVGHGGLQTMAHNINKPDILYLQPHQQLP